VTIAAACAALSTPLAAQTGPATIYRDPGFRGPAVSVNRTEPNLGLRFQVFSIRLGRGAWELCPQPNFRGRCLIVGQTTPDLRRTDGWAGPLQSMRPADAMGPGGPGGGGRSEALRGMASQFFPAPRSGPSGTNGGRVPACPGGSASAACAKDSADRFCRTIGWTRSAFQLLETERARVYLADVLCVRQG
jgi:hypothetical protein